MDDRDAALLRLAALEALGDAVDQRQLARLGAGPLPRPALDLAVEVAVLPREIGEADGGEIDGVQLGQDVDQVERNIVPRIAAERGRLLH